MFCRLKKVLSTLLIYIRIKHTAGSSSPLILNIALLGRLIAIIILPLEDILRHAAATPNQVNVHDPPH